MTWIQTFTGRKIYPLDIRSGDICIEDIAHSLAYQCRFNGHSLCYYSVAEHSVIVSQFVPIELALDGLLHDASEAYLCDLPRPLKQSFHDYVKAEQNAERVIARKFGTKFPIHPAVKEIDNQILLDERDQIMVPCEHEWSLTGNPLGVRLECWSPEEAEDRFLERYNWLTEARDY